MIEKKSFVAKSSFMMGLGSNTLIRLIMKRFLMTDSFFRTDRFSFGCDSFSQKIMVSSVMVDIAIAAKAVPLNPSEVEAVIPPMPGPIINPIPVIPPRKPKIYDFS